MRHKVTDAGNRRFVDACMQVSSNDEASVEASMTKMLALPLQPEAFKKHLHDGSISAVCA